MTTTAPLVSVVIPTYQRVRFVVDAVRSALAQTEPDLEVLVADDGSSDGTRERLQEVFDDPRLHYLRQDNRGNAEARNLALRAARGEWVAFLDSDNLWPPNRLRIQLEQAREHPEADVFYGDVIEIDEAGKERTRRNMRRYSGRITAALLRENFVTMNTTLVRRRCFRELGLLDARLQRAPDYELWLRFSARYRFLYIPRYLAYYRVMRNQISSDKDGRFRANRQIVEEFLERHPELCTARERALGLAHLEARWARDLFRRCRHREAWAHVAASLRHTALGPGWRTAAHGVRESLRRRPAP